MKQNNRDREDIKNLFDLTQYYSLYRTALTLVHVNPNRLLPKKKEKYDRTMLSFKQAASLTPYELARPAYEIMADRGLIDKQWVADRDIRWAEENRVRYKSPDDLEKKLFESRMAEVSRLRAVTPGILSECISSSDRTSDKAKMAGTLSSMISAENNMDDVLRDNEEQTAIKLGISLDMPDDFKK